MTTRCGQEHTAFFSLKTKGRGLTGAGSREHANNIGTTDNTSDNTFVLSWVYLSLANDDTDWRCPMIVSKDATVVSLRLGPGEDLLKTLSSVLDSHDADGGALVSAAGSLEFLRYSVVKPDIDGVPRYTNIVEETGAIEITSLQGHLGRETNGEAVCHFHGTFARDDGSLRAGHVFGARALVTIELTVLLSSGVAWKRSSMKYGNGHEMPILLPVQRD
jgi:predicted DNA-binding protein with PD1-like motif